MHSRAPSLGAYQPLPLAQISGFVGLKIYCPSAGRASFDNQTHHLPFRSGGVNTTNLV